MTDDPFFNSVKNHFQYLVREFGFKVVREKTYPHFDFAHVVFRSDDSLVKVSREKGVVMVDISPVISPEYWVDLPAIMEYLFKEVDTGINETKFSDDSDAGIDRQVEHWAGVYKPICTKISPLTRDASQWAELKIFLEKRNEKWFEGLSNRQ